MTKLEFMKELESLLLDVPLEEREEALQYYRDYFEDAGEDREEDIIKELGAPGRVAAIIKADLNSNFDDREIRGYFTEKGYQDTIYNEAKYEIVGAAGGGAKQGEPSGMGQNRQNDNSTYHRANEAGPKQNHNYQQGQGNTYQNNQQSKSNNTALIVLIAIFTFPIWFSILSALFGILLGIAGALFGLIVGLGAAGVSMIIGGIVLFIAGLIELGVPFVGLLFCGGGLVLFGLGMLFTAACGAICKTIIPAFIKGIVNLCKMPFKNRSVMA